MAIEKRVTEVDYEVDKAINSLNKLDDQVERSAGTADKSFRDAGKSSEYFERQLGKLSPQAANVASEMRALQGVFGATGIAVGAVVGSFAALAGQFLNIPEFTRDTEAGLSAINKGLERQLELRNLLSDIQDALVNRRFLEEQIKLEKERGRIAEETSGLREEQAAIQKRLNLYTGFYNELNQKARDSARERESLEDRLTGLINKAIDRQTSNLPAPFQIKSLIEQAGKATGAGDFDRAEQLLDKAASVSQQTGQAQAFFLKQVEEAEAKLAAQIQKRIDQRKQEENIIKQSTAALKQQIDTDKGQQRALGVRAQELSAERTGLRARAIEINLARRLALEEQAVDDATRRRAAAQQQIVNLLNTQRSTYEKIKTLIGGAVEIVNPFDVSGPDVVAQIKEVNEVRQQLIDASAKLSNRTVEDDQAAGEAINSALERYNDLRARLEEGTLADIFKRDLDQIDQTFTKFFDVLKQDTSAEKAGSGIFDAGKEEGLFKGASNNIKQSADDAEQLAGFMERAALASERIGVTGAPPAGSVAIQAANQNAIPGAAPVQQVASTINVNAEVKGGIIDAETTRTITEIIRRELRRGTDTLG